ncbi:EPIDERMAL PATTERNING FACTOR-like protein 9 isoform X2 [Juglans regia]|uniref:EPIDERMAL PATTERNING FACTOR-like protein 9 isoform X2 n=1 Tax=Juglans regia TaxID=51240 RepID=A0A2I4F6Y6_JUGRE|nr:EPIDERMAL PATTERNING FACTOR-like protein 9 isoform X2 [Juglans regia]
MASMKLSNIVLLFFMTFTLAACVIQGSRNQSELQRPRVLHPFGLQKALYLKAGSERMMRRNSRRLMIGSTAPTCTYNECRGCKYRCRAEQVPVEGDDPINSPYHYRCVCHR